MFCSSFVVHLVELQMCKSACFPSTIGLFGRFCSSVWVGRFRARWGPKGPTSPNPSLFLLALFVGPFVLSACFHFFLEGLESSEVARRASSPDHKPSLFLFSLFCFILLWLFLLFCVCLFFVCFVSLLLLFCSVFFLFVMFLFCVFVICLFFLFRCLDCVSCFAFSLRAKTPWSLQFECFGCNVASNIVFSSVLVLAIL